MTLKAKPTCNSYATQRAREPVSAQFACNRLSYRLAFLHSPAIMRSRPFIVVPATVVGLVFTGAAASTWAVNHTITSPDDSGAGSLRQAIAASLSGDTIDFAVTGTINLTSRE